ncbi:MAG: hypothetical protein F6K26_20040 [Moorea sp. SIO2I5]|nr:hypothetical protein [Moorena sp. SIO2I5]
MRVKKIPIQVGWAKFYYLEYSFEPNCFCPPYKLPTPYSLFPTPYSLQICYKYFQNMLQ